MKHVDLWRIAKSTPAFEASDLSGGGAKAVGGRWNSVGQAVVYASPSIALATLETLAHIGDEINVRNRFLVRITVPVAVWKRRHVIDVTNHPTWLAEPPGASSMALGDAWISSDASAIAVVPSVLIHEECNVLINPRHVDAKKIDAIIVRQFVYDPRLK